MDTKRAFVTSRASGESLNVMGADVTFLCPSSRTAGAWSMMEVMLPRHAGPPPHHHPWDEAYYVIQGEVLFSVDGQERRVEPGEFVYAPGGTVHGFRGAPDDPARMLIFDAPAHAEAFFREVDSQVKAPEDMHKVPGIGLQHQIHFLRSAPGA